MRNLFLFLLLLLALPVMAEKRYYLAPVKGDGLSAATAFEPDFPLGTNWTAEMPVSRAWALVLVATSSAGHTTFTADAKYGALPNLANKDAVPNNANRTAINNACAKFSIPTTGVTSSTISFRQSINAIGKKASPTFSDTALDMADKP